MTERRFGLGVPAMRGLIVAVLVLSLEAVGRAGVVSRTVFVAPTEMAATLVRLGQKGELWEHLLRTLQETALAFGLAAVLGVPLGVLLWRWPYLARITEPYLTSLYALPLVVFYPLLLALLGLGMAPIVVIATTMAVVPVIVNSRIGFAEVRDIYRRLGRSVGCSTWQLYSKVLIPAAAPVLFTGLKLGFTYALIGSIGMEFVLAESGLGYAVRYHYNNFDTPEMYAYVLLNLALAIGANAALLRGEHLTLGRTL